MVTQRSQKTLIVEDQQDPSLPNWISISIQEIVESGLRLNASTYGIHARQARETLIKCKHPVTNLLGKNGLATAHYPPRFKRIYVGHSDFPICLPAQINELHPKPTKYISDLSETDIATLRVKKKQVLLTRSGTIGNCTYVRNTLDGIIFSDDLIRIEPKKYSGYIYAFLKSNIGSTIINTNNYGAVVSHIEPEQLESTPIPNPPDSIKKEIHELIEKSFKLRDESNVQIDDAQTLLKEELQLPAIKKLQATTKHFDNKSSIQNYSVPASKINSRFDGSYHVPIVQTIQNHLRKNAKAVADIGDTEISKSILLPGRFKRIYVGEENGVVFFGGKQINELNPANKKYLSLTHHADRIKKQLVLHENMTLITCSGTIGKVVMVPKHWEGWTANQHIIRIVPANNEIAGYIYAWLSSDYAFPLITRFSFGAVVDEIDNNHVAKISIPLLKDKNLQMEINKKILDANKKRAKAYDIEQEALTILSQKVIYAS